MKIRDGEICKEEKRFLEEFFGLARKTGDDVDADSGVGIVLTDILDRLTVLFAEVAAAHRLENRVASALERDMGMGAEFPRSEHTVDDPVSVQDRLDPTNA